MGVVDEAESAPRLADPLHAAGHAGEMVEGREHAVGIRGARRRRQGEAGRDEGVLDLELPDEGQAQVPGAALEQEVHRLREALRPDGFDPQIPAASPDRADRPSCAFGRGDHPLGIGAVGIDDRRAARRQQIGEQAQLGREILLDARVVVEMVAAEIGEARRGDPHAVEAALLDPVGGRLHGELGDALGGEPRQRLVQRHRIGGGQRAVLRAAVA